MRTRVMKMEIAMKAIGVYLRHAFFYNALQHLRGRLTLVTHIINALEVTTSLEILKTDLSFKVTLGPCSACYPNC